MVAISDQNKDPPPTPPSQKRQFRIRATTRQFVPAGICWVVERSFAWLSRYRRLNTIFERSKEYLIAFVAIAFISILSRRLKRLVVEELSA
jgi:transposase